MHFLCVLAISKMKMMGVCFYICDVHMMLCSGGNEIQYLLCTANSGSFTITFRGNTTAAIAFDASISDLEKALEALYT